MVEKRIQWGLKAGLIPYQWCPAWNKPEACSERPGMVSNRKDITHMHKDADTHMHAYTHPIWEPNHNTSWISLLFLSVYTSIHSSQGTGGLIRRGVCRIVFSVYGEGKLLLLWWPWQPNCCSPQAEPKAGEDRTVDLEGRMAKRGLEYTQLWEQSLELPALCVHACHHAFSIDNTKAKTSRSSVRAASQFLFEIWRHVTLKTQPSRKSHPVHRQLILLLRKFNVKKNYI